MNSHDNELEELKNVIQDSKVTDLIFKNLSSEGGESLDSKRFELMVGLIKNLESKIHQLTTQNKKMEDEINNNIINLKNDLDKTNLRNDSNLEKIEILTSNKEEMKIQQNRYLDAFIKNINDRLNKFKEENDEKIQG